MEEDAGAAGLQHLDGALVIVTGSQGSSTSLHLPAAPAGFGARLIGSTNACVESLLGICGVEAGGDSGDEGEILDPGVGEQAGHSDGFLESLHNLLGISHPVSLLDHWNLQLKADSQCQPLEQMIRIAPGLMHQSTGACNSSIASGILVLVDRDANGTYEGCGEDTAVEEDEEDEYEDPPDDRQKANTERYKGAVVLVARGSCAFVQKAIFAQVLSVWSLFSCYDI